MTRNLYQWMDENKTDTTKLELKFASPTHRGFFAKCPINDKEIILSIPVYMFITVQMAFKSHLGK